MSHISGYLHCMWALHFPPCIWVSSKPLGISSFSAPWITSTLLRSDILPRFCTSAPSRVPPPLAFGDLEFLHHRLVAASMRTGIGYIKYISSGRSEGEQMPP